MSRMSASVAKARARPTRCCMPPDSSLTVPVGPLRQAHQLELLIDHAAALVAAGSPRSSRPKPTLSRTVRHGSSPNCWNTMAMRCAPQAAQSRARRRSPMSTWRLAVAHQHAARGSPAFRPLAARSSVDLPEPDRPISTRDLAALDLEIGIGDADDDAGLLGDLARACRPHRALRAPAACARRGRSALLPLNRISTLLEFHALCVMARSPSLPAG